MYLFNFHVHSAIMFNFCFLFFRSIMSTHSSQDELTTRNTTNTQTFLETCVIDEDYKALEEHLFSNPVQRRDHDRCLLRGLQIVQQKERELSHMAQVLTLLLQSDAKWNSDALLDHQKTPYHIIYESPGDHHELLDLMMKSFRQTIINILDFHRRTALIYAVIDCIKCLIANGADVTIGEERDQYFMSRESWTPIMQAIVMLGFVPKNSPVIMSAIFDILFDVSVVRNKKHFRSCKDYIICAVIARNVNCIKKLIKVGAPLDIIAYDDHHVWALVSKEGDVELLECLFNRGLDKDTTDQNGLSVLWWVVYSGKVEAVRYLLELGVAIPTYKPDVRETPCQWCSETRLTIYDYSIQDHQDPCMMTIRDNNLKIVKLLDEYGSKTCKSFIALRRAVKDSSEGLVSYLLNKYTYPLNTEYSTKDSTKRKRTNKLIFTLLAEPFSISTAFITKLLLDHGADPLRQRVPIEVSMPS